MSFMKSKTNNGPSIDYCHRAIFNTYIFFDMFRSGRWQLFPFQVTPHPHLTVPYRVAPMSATHMCLKGMVNCQNSQDKGPPECNSAVGRPRPYSIIILNMRFIPKASLRASSQITASSYILERHLWVKKSKPFVLTPSWSLACRQTDCITAGMWKLPDSEHKTFVWLYTMLDQRRRRWTDVV